MLEAFVAKVSVRQKPCKADNIVDCGDEVVEKSIRKCYFCA
jgi:hypothetical protein